MRVKQAVVDLLIDDVRFSNANKFDLLKAASQVEDTTNDVAILVAMRLNQGQWGELADIATGIVRASGLYPYLSNERVESIPIRDALARSVYGSPTRDDIYLHRAQYSILSKLLSGQSVILSAPTSFGKSFLIEELLLSGRYKNILIVVPTVALIEELRQKIKKVNTEHKRISFTNQELAEQNVFILTQERAYEMYGVIATKGIDLLIVDEFYKMDSSLLEKQDSSDRADMLSVVYRKFSEISKQVYLLGPYINGANGYKTAKHDPVWIESNDNTTYIIKKHVKATIKERSSRTRDIILEHREDVMVYCSSPGTVRNLYLEELHGKFDESDSNDDLIDWIKEYIGAEWYLIDALKRGIGVHHGKLPRFIAHEVIKRFGDGRITVLLCTSSLIEGVNTSAKTIIIHNGKKKYPGDILSFRNISGRAGRMFNHFWGTVYYYEEPPQNDQIVVNDPIGSDQPTASASTLSLLDDSQLSDKQRASVSQRTDSTYIPDDLLKMNHFIEASVQELVFDRFRNEPILSTVISSIGTPSLNSKQMQSVFLLAVQLGLNTFQYAPARESNQTKSIIRLVIFIESYFRGGFRSLASQQNYNQPIDDSAIEKSFYLLKNGFNHDFPKYIRALDRLQKYILGKDAGDLEPFANRLEFLDTHPVYVQLDELGLPIEFSKKYDLPSGSIDESVQQMRRLIPNLNGFEKSIAEDLITKY